MQLTLGATRALGFIYWLAFMIAAVLFYKLRSDTTLIAWIGLSFASLPVGVSLASAARQKSVAAAQEAALTDDLTGLPGRRLFLNRLLRSLEGDTKEHLTAVMFVDLDRFKLINDTLGHPVGDRVLQSVAQRLQKQLTPADTLARYGGDEFTVILDGIPNMDAAKAMAARLLTALNEPVRIDHEEIYTGASIGVAVSAPDAKEPQELIRRADIAVYQAKERGGGRVVFYTPFLAAPVGRLSLENELRSAIERSEICVFYQPEVDLSANRIVGMEALVRWNHRRLGLLLPEHFVGISEEIGVISSLGRWVLREACRQMRVWSEIYGAEDPLTISVNLSALEFRQVSLLSQVERILDETGLDSTRLKLEITESVLMDDIERAAEVLSRMRERGIRIAIDDFGTGYSSLSYLKRLPIDTLKIDQSFLREADSRSLSIVEAVVTLAHSLGMDVTAEGIETQEQLHWLSSIACDRGQGFYLAKPSNTETVDAMFASGWVRHPFLLSDSLYPAA